MSILDYIILAAILIWLIVAVYYIIRQKKAGRSVCCGNSSPHCAGCLKNCHQKKAASLPKPRKGSLRDLME